MIKYAMINSDRIVRITNISGSTYTEENGDKHNVDKIQYVWKKGKPKLKKNYVPIHYLREGG